MREILFRGKRTDNGEWVEGYITECTMIPDDMKSYIGWVIKEKPKKLYDCDLYEVDPATIGQYTGLKDKNGKKIFEGDIIRMHGNPDDIAVVQFGEFGCVDIELESITDRVNGWHYKPLATDALSQLEPFCWEFQLNKMWVEQNDIEIIGNIHDNPETMKGDED